MRVQVSQLILPGLSRNDPRSNPASESAPTGQSAQFELRNWLISFGGESVVAELAEPPNRPIVDKIRR